MKKTKSYFLFVLSLLCSLSMLAINAKACTRAEPFSFSELFDNASVIVRATAVKYLKPSNDPNTMTTGEPEAIVQFKVEEILRGKDVTENISLNGYLNERDDYNDIPVRYTFVRPK